MSDFPGQVDPPVVPSGGLTKLATDANGRIIFSPSGGAYLSYVNFAKRNGVIKAVPGTLLSVSGRNRSGATRYMQVFNKAVAPVLNDIPLAEWLVIDGVQVIIGQDALIDMPFALGIAYGFSSVSGHYDPAGTVDADYDLQAMVSA